MPFEYGHKKSRGRKPGSQNKSRQLVREIVESALKKSIPARLLELSKGSPDVERETLLDLMPYCYPKLQAVEHSGEVANPDGNDAVKALTEELIKITEARH